ncbi:MAG: PD-(D/E)XK nuclease family protein [Desulfobacteraceae bacterium]
MPQTVEKNLQLQIYGWGVRHLFPHSNEVLLRLHFLRYGAEREVLLTPADLKGVPEAVQERIATIEADQNFDPQPGSFCSWCGVQAHCPVMEKSLIPREIIAPATQDEAEAAATLLLALRAMEKELIARLKNWTEINDPIRVGDVWYGPKPAVTYELNPEVVANALLEAGLSREEVWPLLSTSKTALEIGLRRLKRKDLLPGLLKLGQKKIGPKFDFYKEEE